MFPTRKPIVLLHLSGQVIRTTAAPPSTSPAKAGPRPPICRPRRRATQGNKGSCTT
jgi:hypothetical protein